jgi:transcriptional regulator with XRE-family HTH domain
MSVRKYRVRDYATGSNALQGAGLITFVKTVGERIAWARKKRGLTQAQLAKAAGVSQSAIGSYEKGHREKPRELVAIAGALRVFPQWLDEGKGSWDADIAGVPAPTEAELALLIDFRDMPKNDQDELVAEIRLRAERGRAYFNRVLQERGVSAYPPAAPAQPHTVHEPQPARRAKGAGYPTYRRTPMASVTTFSEYKTKTMLALLAEIEAQVKSGEITGLLISAKRGESHHGLALLGDYLDDPAQVPAVTVRINYRINQLIDERLLTPRGGGSVPNIKGRGK